MNCFLHPDRAAIDFLRVPCAPEGKINLCPECKADPQIIQKSFDAYSSRHSKRIKVFKTDPNPHN